MLLSPHSIATGEHPLAPPAASCLLRGRFATAWACRLWSRSDCTDGENYRRGYRHPSIGKAIAVKEYVLIGIDAVIASAYRCRRNFEYPKEGYAPANGGEVWCFDRGHWRILLVR